jgi:hypothetical protein
MLLLLAVGGTGCAQAHHDASLGGRPDGGGIVVHDSNGGGGDDASNIDAPGHPIDAPSSGGTQTLSQTNDQVDARHAVACAADDGVSTIWTVQNSYYRVFTLSDYGITGTFHVTGVDFVVSTEHGSVPLNVSIGTYNGTPTTTLTKSAIALTANTSVTPANTDAAANQHVNITGDVTGKLVVEIDQNTAGTQANPLAFFIGASAGGESKYGYISTTDMDCNLPTPTSMTQVGEQENDILITVTGNY